MECQLCGLDAVTKEALVAHWGRAHNMRPDQVLMVTQGICLDCGQSHDDSREEHGLTNHDIKRLVREMKGLSGVIPVEEEEDWFPGQYL